jgi:hypothetical protein
MQAFVGHWTRRKTLRSYWLCSECGGTFGPPEPRGLSAALDLTTGGPVGADVLALPSNDGNVPGAASFAYEGWVTDDGLVRVTMGRILDRKIATATAITAEQAQKISDDFGDLARAAKGQADRLRGDDRWRVRPCPDRPGVYLVKHRIWLSVYREVPFVATVVRKMNRCDPCGSSAAPGSTMYREENPESGATVSWRHVRICSACVARVDRGSQEQTA